MSRIVLRGRSAEMSVAMAALRAAQHRGLGSLLLFTGAPGIGKTALVRAVHEQAHRRGFVVGSSAADNLTELVPGSLLLLALRSGPDPVAGQEVFRRLSALADSPLWLAEELTDLLDRRSQQAPVLIALDDTQWADPLSRFLIRVLASRLTGSPLVWLIASRQDAAEVMQDFEAIRTLDDVVARHVELGPLSDDDVVAAATDLLGESPPERVIRWLHQAGGNPFLAVELSESLRQDKQAGRETGRLPASFSVRLRSRMRDLDPDAHRLLELAAVWGRPLPMADAARMLDIGEISAREAIRPAAGQGLIDNPDDVISFRHDLIREVVYQEIGPARRISLHRRAARHLVESGQPVIEAAFHAEIGAQHGDRESISLLRRAAVEALGDSPATAARFLKQAFDQLSIADPDWSAAGEQYANALWHAHRGAESLAVIDLICAQELSEPTRARLEVLAAHALWLTGQPGNVVERTETRLSDRRLTALVRVRLEATRALALSRVGTPDAAYSAARMALARARDVRDGQSEITALHALGEVARNEGHHRQAYECFHELRVSRGADYAAQEVTSLQHLDRFDEAQALLTETLHSRAGQSDTASPALASAQLWQYFNLGRFAEADAEARGLIRLGDELGNFVHRLDSRVAMGTVAIIHGDLPRARAIVATAQAESELEDIADAPGLLLVQARVASAERNYPMALQLLRTLDAIETAAHTYWSRSLAQLRLRAGIAIQTADREFALETKERATLAAQRNPDVPSYQGVALQVAGVLNGDLELLRTAAEILRRCPRPSMGATAIEDYGTALLNAGHRRDGVKLLEEAWATFDAVNSRSRAAAVQRRLRDAGVRRIRRPRAARATVGWAALTDTEAQVARLIVAGHTNRSAAAALGISANTIGTHLRSVFAKLEVHSRLQLVNAVRELGAGDQTGPS
jgi:DNA-binding CsgD family transcriptional regulator